MDVQGLESHWDLVIAGGGITGAGIFLEAARQGLKVLLVEQKDFAWGTSSRSSKLVHGGLRYLNQGRFNLTFASVRERQRLLCDENGLVSPLSFFMPVYKGHGPSMKMMTVGLSIYSLMAMKRQHCQWSPREIAGRWPFAETRRMTGGFTFSDAQTDDARLVLKLIQKGQALGGTALNYTRLCTVERNTRGRVCAAVLQDTGSGRSMEVEAGIVVNATGAWVDRLQAFPAKGFRLRPLRGSHLVFPGHLFPSKDAVSFSHPRDRRPVFILPWEGTALVGTTDIDHEESLAHEPSITREEAAYLMEAVRFIMPGHRVRQEDCIGSFAGVRPVLTRGRTSASKESREHLIVESRGLISITGGKLTTFRLVALDVLSMVNRYLGHGSTRCRHYRKSVETAWTMTGDPISGCRPETSARLAGRYGPETAARICKAAQGQTEPHISGTQVLWSEIAYSAANEQVRTLSDLLLRRVRIGLTLPKGGSYLLDKVQEVCRASLSWDDARWETEKKEYCSTWYRYYRSPFSRD